MDDLLNVFDKFMGIMLIHFKRVRQTCSPPSETSWGCVAPIQVSVDDLLTSLTSSRALYGPTSGECGLPVYHTRQPYGGYVAHIEVSVDNFPNVFGSLMDIMMILFI